MKVYTTDSIRNVVLLGHGGSGKTTLTEAMAYLTGAVTRMGKVTDGNTISDYRKEEQNRKFSIGLSVVPLEWNNTKINLLDTPGYLDFVGEVESAVSAADGAIICVSGKEGVEAGTKKAWELCDKYHLPRIVYVTDMDIDNASFRQVVADLKELYGKCIAPFHLPIRQNEKFIGYINVISRTGNKWLPDGTVEPFEIPEYSLDNMNLCRDALVEAVAETSEEFMERFFEGEEFSEAEIRAALKLNVADGSVVPVTMGSAVLVQGVYTLLDDIVKYLPGPDKRTCAGINMRTHELFEANYDFYKTKSAYIFKTIVDPFIGKYSFIKVCSGVLKSDDTVYNVDKDCEEKLSRLYVMRGNKPVEVQELHAGDIGAIGKLSKARTGDTISTKNNPVSYAKTEYSVPYTYMRYRAVKKGDEDRISQALQKLTHEDQTMRHTNDVENHQLLIYGMGDLHIEVLAGRLLQEYKVEITLERPKVAYKETILGNADVEAKYKKQSGGHGQYSHVKMTFAPSGDLTVPYLFEEKVVGGAVPRSFFPAVEKGLEESVLKGPMAGYPVVGVKAVLYDGSYHSVDSSELAFKMAAIQAFKDGFLKAKPVLLEPVMTLLVTVPESCTGDIMKGLTERRGRVLGIEPAGNGKQQISAEVPESELHGYCTALRSATGGSGDFSYTFARYEQAPVKIQEQEISKSKQ